MTDWRATLTSAAFLAAVDAPVRTIAARAELVDYSGNPVPLRVSEAGPVWDLPLKSASVEFRGESAEQFAGRLTFTDPTLIPTRATHPLDPRAALMVRLWWRIMVTPEIPAIPATPLGTPTITASSASANQGAAKAFDGVVSGYPTDYTKEWAAVGKTGQWIQATYATLVRLSSVTLHDRINTSDNITAGTLSFSDGSTVAVGALPTDGTGLVVTFTARTVTWVRFAIDTAAGTNTGLAEMVVGAAGETPATPATWLEVPVMTGIPEDPDTRDTGTTSTTMTLRDPLATVRGGYGGTPLVVSGMTVPAAISAIFARVAPTLRVTIEDSAVTLPTTYVLGGRSPMEDIRELAGMGYSHGRVMTSRDGSIRVGSRPEPTGELDWQEGPTCAVTEMTRSLTTSRMGNRQTVLYSGNDETLVGLYATVEDDDPTSPTWVGGPWGVHPLPDITSDAVTTVAACENLARMHLGRGLHPTEDIEVVIPQRPDLSYRQAVRLARAQLGVGDTYRVSSWTLGLPATGEAPALITVKMMERTAE